MQCAPGTVRQMEQFFGDFRATTDIGEMGECLPGSSDPLSVLVVAHALHMGDAGPVQSWWLGREIARFTIDARHCGTARDVPPRPR